MKSAAVQRIIRTPKAAEDLIDIYSYIARRDPQAATRMLLGLGRQIELLAERPRIGRLRDDLRAGLRSWPFRRHVVLYRTISNGIEIIRVVHGARDLAAVLAEDANADDTDSDSRHQE